MYEVVVWMLQKKYKMWKRGASFISPTYKLEHKDSLQSPWWYSIHIKMESCIQLLVWCWPVGCSVKRYVWCDWSYLFYSCANYLNIMPTTGLLFLPIFNTLPEPQPIRLQWYWELWAASREGGSCGLLRDVFSMQFMRFASFSWHSGPPSRLWDVYLRWRSPKIAGRGFNTN